MANLQYTFLSWFETVLVVILSAWIMQGACGGGARPVRDRGARSARPMHRDHHADLPASRRPRHHRHLNDAAAVRCAHTRLPLGTL
jgi:hypothetical protein